jgi:aquaporin Z
LQFAGGLLGVGLVIAVLGDSFTQPPVATVVTVPGDQGPLAAFVAELVIAFVTMMTVLVVSNTPRFARSTGLCVGVLIVVYITVEAPLSGFGMNPARTFASALPSNTWTGFWVYLIAPPLGMLLAAQTYLALRGAANVFCAKLHHPNHKRCIFCASRRAAQPGGRPSSDAGRRAPATVG